MFERPSMPGLRFSPACALTGLVLAALALTGCRQLGQEFGDVTGSIGAPASPTDEAKARAQLSQLQQRYESDPGEKAASIAYARSLRAFTRYDEAVAVMQAAAVKTAKDEDVLGEYGKALADAGQLSQARDVLTRAYPLDNPKWDVMSVQGSIADRLGDHAAAMAFYREALKIAPGEPSILTNLGLSYALTKQLPDAERTLRDAAASPKAGARTRGDLALVLALEGKYAEAEQVGRSDLSADAARANVEAVRRMVARDGVSRAPANG
jgi:Flp pilus assembly protein TadD